MRLCLVILTAVAVLPATGVFAQEATDPRSILPQACRAAMMAADHSLAGATAAGAASTEASKKAMPAMNAAPPVEHAVTGDAPRETLDAVNRMHEPMMAAAKITDPDLAFNCGMLIHHQGAIDMARIELKYGKDEQSRKKAEMIIEAQSKEIAEMSAHIETMTKQ